MLYSYHKCSLFPVFYTQIQQNYKRQKENKREAQLLYKNKTSDKLDKKKELLEEFLRRPRTMIVTTDNDKYMSQMVYSIEIVLQHKT